MIDDRWTIRLNGPVVPACWNLTPIKFLAVPKPQENDIRLDICFVDYKGQVIRFVHNSLILPYGKMEDSL